VDEVRRIVAGAAHVHAIGTRHSFNAVADSPGDLIDVGGIAPAFTIDREQRTVTAGAGANYGEVAAFVHGEGWALLNMPSLPHVSIGGAVATGTHGSGDQLGNLATAVAGLEMVTATGDLVTMRRGEAGFDGMVVALGALGVVTRITLDIQPAFELRQDAFEGLAWDRLHADFDAVMSAGYSVSLMTSWSSPTVSRFWIKTRVVDGAPASVSGAPFGASAAITPLVNDLPGLGPFGVAGPWLDSLAHFRPLVQPGLAGHLQSEYMLPRARATEAIALLRGIGERIDRHLLVTEIRSMTGDSLWLSPSYGHPAIALHFSWQRDIAAVAAITAEIEALLLPLGGRPHWGKIMHSPRDQLAPLYPKLQAFGELARSYDPDGKFTNAFLRAHVLGAQ
jgi:xylitol oxidase